MALATAHTVALQGALGHLIDVQADISPGTPGTTLVGRPDASLHEARDRCRMAVSNSGAQWPATRRVTILLAPSDLVKRGTHFDLAIALAVLAASDEISQRSLDDTLVIGELTLTGGLRSVPGVLPMVMAASRRGFTRVIVPEPQAREAAMVPGMSVLGMRSLAQVRAELRGEVVPDAEPVAPMSGGRLIEWRGSRRLTEHDLADLSGVPDVKYALEVAAAGGHHLMLSGPKGAGKTSLAERLPGLLPDLSVEESLELTAIHSLAGALEPGDDLIRRPPFFAPHHDASKASLLGGGTGRVRPGEVSRSHCGVLFLDRYSCRSAIKGDVVSGPKAIYARISDDTEDTGQGVERQVRDCRQLCKIREWTGRTYIDNDLSAYKRSVVRPAFERMLRDLGAGAVAGIVVYDLDRLARQPRDLERLIELYDPHPGLTFATVQGDVNLATPDGRTMARVMVAFANKASMDTGRRTARKHLELAEQGEPVGRRAFGWQADKRTLDPVEAEHVRSLVERVIHGDGVRELVRQWNDAGIVTAAGGLWSHQALRKYLRNPRLVGLRTRHGKVFTDQRGEPVRGTWEPLLDQTTYDQLQLVLDGRTATGGPTGRRGARKYLLTGLLRCGICAAFLYGSKAREDGRFNYVCNDSSQARGDRHTLSVSGAPVDDAVSELVFAILAREEIEEAAQDWPHEAQLEEVGAKIRELMGAFDAGQLSGSIVFPRVRPLEDEQARLRRAREAWQAEQIVRGEVTSLMTRDEWDAMAPQQKRAHIDIVLSEVVVRPAKGRSGTLDFDRLVPVPRQAEQEIHQPTPKGTNDD